jgi:plasmid maintenance system antidote protein VapI
MASKSGVSRYRSKIGKVFFGISPEFWLGLQAQYDLDITTEVLGERLELEVRTYAVNK